MQSRAMRMRDIIRGDAIDRFDYTVVFDEYGQNSYNTLLAADGGIADASPYGRKFEEMADFYSSARGMMYDNTVSAAFRCTLPRWR